MGCALSVRASVIGVGEDYVHFKFKRCASRNTNIFKLCHVLPCNNAIVSSLLGASMIPCVVPADDHVDMCFLWCGNSLARCVNKM